jgi:hypothetical protein
MFRIQDDEKREVPRREDTEGIALVSSGHSRAKNLKLITLARDAMMVPMPPTLTPTNSPAASVVNGDSRMAAGTL